MLTNKIQLGLNWPDLEGGFTVWAAHLRSKDGHFVLRYIGSGSLCTHLTCGNRAECLDVSPGALLPVPPAKPRVHGKSLATEVTLPGVDS